VPSGCARDIARALRRGGETSAGLRRRWATLNGKRRQGGRKRCTAATVPGRGEGALKRAKDEAWCFARSRLGTGRGTPEERRTAPRPFLFPLPFSPSPFRPPLLRRQYPPPSSLRPEPVGELPAASLRARGELNDEQKNRERHSVKGRKEEGGDPHLPRWKSWHQTWRPSPVRLRAATPRGHRVVRCRSHAAVGEPGSLIRPASIERRLGNVCPVVHSVHPHA